MEVIQRTACYSRDIIVQKNLNYGFKQKIWNLKQVC